MAFVIDRERRAVVDDSRGYMLRKAGGSSDGMSYFEFSGPEGNFKIHAEEFYRPFTAEEEQIFKDAPERVVGQWLINNIRPNHKIWPVLREAMTVNKLALGVPEYLPWEVI